MDVSDLTVEVRDRELRRRGQIAPEYLNCRLEPAYAAVGKWTVTLPSEHPMASILEQPGSGIVVSHTHEETQYIDGAIQTNYITNPGPTGATTGWLASPGESASLVTDEVDGLPAIELTDPDGGGGGYLYQLQTTDLPAVGAYVAFGVDVRAMAALSGSTMRLVIQSRTSSSTLIERVIQSVPIANDGAYHRVTVVLPITQATQQIQPIVWPSNSTPVGAQFRARHGVMAVAATAADALAVVSKFWSGAGGPGTYRYAWVTANGRSTRTEVVPTTVKITDTLLSGPQTEPDRTASTGDPQGMSTFTGVTDNVVLWNRVAYPTPGSPLSSQTSAYDVVTNVDGETAMRHYVEANAGPSALAERRVLTISEANAHRGGLVTKTARYDTLGELLASIATVSGLGFQVIQVDDHLEFQTLDVRDRRKRVRLDLANGTLASQNVKRRAPSATAMIVAGQGDGADRTILEKVNDGDDVAAYGPFSRVEVFKDQRNTDDPLELEQAADEGLTDGAPSFAVTAVPGDDSTMAYPQDWALGDTITVVVDDQETAAQVTGAIILVNADAGVRVGASIGDVQGWDPQASLRKTVASQEQRLSALERNDPVGADFPFPRRRRLPMAATSGVSTIGVRAIDVTLTNPYPERSVLVTYVSNADVVPTAANARPSIVGAIEDASNTTVARWEDVATSSAATSSTRQAVVSHLFPVGTQTFRVSTSILNRNTTGTVSVSGGSNTDYATVTVEPAQEF